MFREHFTAIIEFPRVFKEYATSKLTIGNLARKIDLSTSGVRKDGLRNAQQLIQKGL